MPDRYEHRIHLVSGEMVTVFGARIADSESDSESGQHLIFETENALYRFWWPNVLYVMSRRRSP